MLMFLIRVFGFVDIKLGGSFFFAYFLVRGVYMHCSRELYFRIIYARQSVFPQKTSVCCILKCYEHGSLFSLKILPYTVFWNAICTTVLFFSKNTAVCTVFCNAICTAVHVLLKILPCTKS